MRCVSRGGIKRCCGLWDLSGHKKIIKLIFKKPIKKISGLFSIVVIKLVKELKSLPAGRQGG